MSTTKTKAKTKKTSKSKKNDDVMSDVVSIVEKSLLRKRKSTLYSVIGLVALVAAAAIYIWPLAKSFIAGMQHTPSIAVINEMTDEDKAELLKNKAIEIKNIVLGEARQRKELLVLERDIKVESVMESALGGFEVFKKTKKIVSYGTGYFDVDLGALNEDSIHVDSERNVITITVPHAKLKSISVDEGKTEYEDTQKGGMLGFGELKLTAEQQGLLKKEIEDNMRVELEKPAVLAQADQAGKESVAEIYKPLINAISEDYIVEVTMADQ